MALTIDINAGGDFNKQILQTSKALEEVAKQEERVNKLAAFFDVSEQKISKTLAAQAKIDQDNSKKAAKAIAEKAKAEKDFTKDLALGVAGIGLAALGAVTAIASLGLEIGKAAKDAEDARRGATAMIDAFTNHQGERTLAALDGWATKLGLSFDETRQKFIEFREAGKTNAMSLTLIKARADLMALGQSAKQADSEIAPILSAGRDRYASARALDELTRAYARYGQVGKGAIAASYAVQSVDAAQNRISNVTTEALADLWKKIGPDIGRAANRLADFAEKLIGSKEGKEALDGVAEAFKNIAKAVNSDNLMAGLTAIKYTAKAIELSFKAAAAAWGLISGATLQKALTSGVPQPSAAEQADFDARSARNGQAIAQGLADGMTKGKALISGASKAMADTVSDTFTQVTGIHSPSKMFAEYGENIVQGLRLGQTRELGNGDMPVTESATRPPRMSAGSSVTAGITIQNLIVQGGGSPDQIGRSVRQELQLLLQAGAMSRGLNG